MNLSVIRTDALRSNHHKKYKMHHNQKPGLLRSLVVDSYGAEKHNQRNDKCIDMKGDVNCFHSVSNLSTR